MSFSTEEIIRLYVEEEMSLRQIAEKYNVYANKIRRLLIKCGVTLRTTSESQKIALENGRSKHPTKGRKRRDDEKERIGMAVHEGWQAKPKEEIDEFRKLAKERWEEKTEEEKDFIIDRAREGLRKSAKDGSKMEIYLQEELIKRGLIVIFHKKNLVINQNLEVDLFLPEYTLVIEIDGPTHFFPIFGEEQLQKTIASDRLKIGLLIEAGIHILRIKNIDRSPSRAKAFKMADLIEKFIEETTKSDRPLFREVEIEGRRNKKVAY